MLRRTATRLATLALVPALLALAGPSARADLVTNGDFSGVVPAFPAGGFVALPGGDTGLSGWTISGNNVLVIDRTYHEVGSNILFNTPDAATSHALDITGVGNTGLNGISQVLSTVTGQTYLLAFALGNAFSPTNTSYQGTAMVLVSAGAQLQTFANSSTTPYGVSWQNESLVFTATGPSTVLTFLNATSSRTFYAGLDHIRVSAIPEPGILPLASAGLPLVLSLAWFRRRLSR